jgi:hypothetical protein
MQLPDEVSGVDLMPHLDIVCSARHVVSCRCADPVDVTALQQVHNTVGQPSERMPCVLYEFCHALLLSTHNILRPSGRSLPLGANATRTVISSP